MAKTVLTYEMNESADESGPHVPSHSEELKYSPQDALKIVQMKPHSKYLLLQVHNMDQPWFLWCTTYPAVICTKTKDYYRRCNNGST